MDNLAYDLLNQLCRTRYSMNSTEIVNEAGRKLILRKGGVLISISVPYMKVTNRSKLSHYFHKVIAYIVKRCKAERGIITPEIAAGRSHGGKRWELPLK